ncbi:uncharacterized protein CTHT_0000420 [Thermochaetoides thermophila DSM 1495]|uniref:DNA helicase n=1 Tax=Chaetomium thermophilum (strain DSM 1495 / CBS 144.50 / IMI 039719) TaxID=759272 RepID=G0RXU5_CHATD|nr:hypothetical protein CTHT_0000420 [Thermochaetoides thermophila DSM 1495]EGS24111.1 hypothetical protein CTHT_0000420 [Thermochaetoides thermophila DSM 1495]
MTEIASPSPTHAHPPPAPAPGDHDDKHPNTTSSTTPPRSRESVGPDQLPSAHTTNGVNGDAKNESGGTTEEQPQNSVEAPHADSGDGTGRNGARTASEVADAQEGPPPKRRRVRDATPSRPSRRHKPDSPPWKKVEADGPSTFITEDGRRKSGRLNAVPLELRESDKRITRGVFHSQQPNSSKATHATANGHAPNHPSTPASASHKRAATSSSKQGSSKAPAPTSASRRPATAQDSKSSNRNRRRSPSPKPSPKRHATTAKQPAMGTRRSARHLRDTEDDADEITARSTTRIKLRVRPPLTELPLVHRDQAFVRPKIGPTFAEWFEKAADIPVEQGGLYVPSEDGPKYTDEMAREDAKIILRVEKEVEPGGILAPDRCSIFEPEPPEEPPRQWAHMDHLVKQMANFRRLMLQEQQRHRAIAKRLAIACEAEWKRRNPQPKTAEEIEQEEIEKSKAKLRQVMKTLVGTWENVRAEVNRRRLAEWEAEEQRRVKAALNEAVNLSEQKLQARQAHFDAFEPSEEEMEDEHEEDLLTDSAEEEGSDGDSEASEDVSESESDMMSSSEDEEEEEDSVISDENLTQEELRAKYANLPDLNNSTDSNAESEAPPDTPAADNPDNEDETSDESIDMDDDLGSTMDEEEDEDDESDEEDEEEESEEEESDDEPSGLLGLFFNKAELKRLKEEAAKEEATEEVVPDEQRSQEQESHGPVDVEMVDVDAVTVAEPISKAAASTDSMVGADEQNAALTQVSKASMADNTAKPSREIREEQSDNAALVFGERSEPKQEPLDDVDMIDLPEAEGPDAAASTLETNLPPTTQHPTPETEPVTTIHSPSRSQSPRPSDDTKPTDIETPASTALVNQPKPNSRSASPQPAPPRTEIPFLLRGTLREYQHHGLDWLASLYANRTNGILADEMGLGKTIQTIALLAHLACHHEVWGPHLIIVPTSVMLNWEMEFKKWCPGFKILTYYGNQEERKRKRQGWTNDDVWNVCITSYQMVLQDQQVFRRRRWHYMILDEAHNIKNFKSQRWQTLLGFNTHSRLLLTGTPLQNNLTELWSLLYFLAPPENGEGGFVDLQEFHNWFSRPESQILESGRDQLDDEARAIIAKLHKVLRPYLLRRLKSDVEKQMPAKYEHIEFCRLSKRQRELYDGFLSRADTRATLASGNYMSIINCLMQLRKVCNHPDLFVDRPIMTSFRMSRSVAADYEYKEQIVQKRLLVEHPMKRVSLSFLNMIPTIYETMSKQDADRISQLSSHRILLDLRDAQAVRANNASRQLDPTTVQSNLVYLESVARWSRFEELQHCVYVNALRRQQRPIYGKRLIEMLTLNTHLRPFKPRPKVPAKVMSWFEEDSWLLRNAIPTLQQRADSMEMTITKFACVTPAVVTGDMTRILLGREGVEAFTELDLKLSAPIKYAPYMPPERPPDPWHEARMRLTIQFPDKRLLQYDCGKLQVLDKLLRKLQAEGHRALIFTQMTKVLDILEQFLNIHGHKYLRLDGATKVEQRQILTDRFNNDPRILCFILSTRSGGLGINLTGADTVIFYDQDWNPAMDKQCQDRCHRIGQTRDVHIYRLVSEHTIEANILRKASQKQMLDDVVIQEGEFTTDYFRKLAVRDVIGSNGEVMQNEDDVAANAAMDRVLGGVENTNLRNVSRVLEQAEDKEDVAAARVAEKEIQQDDVDFLEASTAGVGTSREGTNEPGQLHKAAQEEGESEVEYNAWGSRMGTIDDYMLKFMTAQLEGTPLDLPKDKKKGKKKGKDTRKR